MFSTEFSNSSHGATKGSTSSTLTGYEMPLFTGTEGPEAATHLYTAIEITLGRMNGLPFLTKKLKDILDEIPMPDSASAQFQTYTFERNIISEWNRAYWTIRVFFKPSTPARAYEAIRQNYGPT